MKKIKRNFIKFLNKKPKLYKVQFIDIIRFILMGLYLGAFLTLTFSKYCQAADINLKYGVGFGMTGMANLSEVKFLSLGYQSDIPSSIFRAKFDIGAWFDSRENDTLRKSSLFLSPAIGLRVEPGWFYVENYLGIAYVDKPDSQLGIPFEFTEEFGFGVKDKRGRSTGIQWKHFSNAGIHPVNKGRDFFLVNIGMPL